MDHNNSMKSALAPETSPLIEADPESLEFLVEERVNTIFNKPPLSINSAELAFLVNYYRQERLKFKQDSEIKATSEKKPRGAKKPSPKSIKEITDTFPNSDEFSF